MAFFEPSLIFELVQGFKHGFSADSVCSVRVCKVTCKVNLMRLNLLEQIYDYVYVRLGALSLLDAAGLIERQVEEVCVGVCIQAE